MILMIRKKHILCTLAVCAAAFLFAVGIVKGVGAFLSGSVNTTADGNWGLSFQEEGKTPIGNADADYLRKYDAYYAEDTEKKVMYLTFDAGYENGYTAKILDTLKEHNVKATFFLVGNYIETSPKLVKRMVKEGHLVGNHTYTHPDMSEISTEESFREELEMLEHAYREVTGGGINAAA